MATTSSHSSPIQSSFTINALTTTFTPPATCTGAFESGGVYVLAEDTACKPSGFADASTDYFSPGLACPSGYSTACHDNAGVASITTVTCCPMFADFGLGCVTPSTLSDVWATLYCTWVAPEAATTVSVTRSHDGTTSTVVESVSSPGGLNAQGIRMVYEATDAAATTTGSTSGSGSGASATATATTTGSSTSSISPSSSSSSSTGSSGSGGSSGLSTGATVAIAVVVAVVGIGLVIGTFVWLRKRKQRQPYSADGTNSPGAATGSSTMNHKYTGQYEPSTTQELSGVGATGVRNQQQELAELGSEQPVELPASETWR